MLNHDDSTTQNPQDHDLTHYSAEFLLYLLPMTLWQLLALQELLRKPVGDGPIKKSTSSLTMLNNIVFWQLQEAPI